MELEVVTGSYDGLVQGFSIDALDPGSEVCKQSSVKLMMYCYLAPRPLPAVIH